MKNKRAQSAAGAAVLVVIIAVLLIMFIAVMPPKERAELLGETSANGSTTGTSSSEGIEDAVPEKILLTTTPGRIDYLAQNEMEHPLPVINVYTRTDAQVLGEKKTVYAKKSSFSEEKSTLKFEIPDLTHSQNFLLNFAVLEVKGRLVMMLNGEEIFNAEIETTSLPLTLPKNLLQEENELVFSAVSPGLAFWATNVVSLENVKVVADVTDVGAQSAKNIFLVSEMEKRNLEKVILKFQPTCNYGEVGRLMVYVNGEEIYSGIPDCDLAMVPIEFSPNLVYEGENELVFRTEKGTFLLSHVMVQSKLKEVDFPTYYFELSYEQYTAVKDEDRRVRLEMDFVDVVTAKYGDIVFNGHLYPFDTKEVTYTVDLSEDIVRGNNALKIKPKKSIEIRELRVDLVK